MGAVAMMEGDGSVAAGEVVEGEVPFGNGADEKCALASFRGKIACGGPDEEPSALSTESALPPRPFAGPPGAPLAADDDVGTPVRLPFVNV